MGTCQEFYGSHYHLTGNSLIMIFLVYCLNNNKILIKLWPGVN